MFSMGAASCNCVLKGTFTNKVLTKGTVRLASPLLEEQGSEVCVEAAQSLRG